MTKKPVQIIVGKKELVQSIVDKAAQKGLKLTQKDAKDYFDSTLEVIQETLTSKEDKKISLIGFGVFSVKYRAARKGMNLQTRKEITIDESYSPSFKPSKVFKDSVNESRKKPAKKTKK